jgi:lipopolysaccharide cholinephosphotransferase
MQLNNSKNYSDEIYIILFILLVIVLYLDFIYLTKPTHLDELAMTEKDKEDIYTYLEYFINFLEKHNITYWIIGGTTLGCVRHNDIVPWDDDADIGIFEDDLEKLLNLKEELKNDGYEIIFYWKIYKFRKINQEYPFIDIFCYKKDNDRYIMHRDDLNEVWSNEYYLENELFPLRKYKFGKLILNGPNYPLDYLDRMYPKWRFVGKHTFDHKENKSTSITVNLDPKNPEHKLKEIKYIDKNSDLMKEFDENHYEKIITVE